MNIDISLQCPYDKRDGITSINKQLALELVGATLDMVADELYVTIGRSYGGTIWMEVVDKHDNLVSEHTWQEGKWVMTC
jgi:hypothetical protein